MSFFIKHKQPNGIKRSKYSTDKNKKRKPIKKVKKDEEITSSEDEFDDNNDTNDHPTSSEDENETAQDKKLRLAKVYLKEIEREEQARLESEQVDHGVLTKRLKEDYLSQVGKLRLQVADKYEKNVNIDEIKLLKCKEIHGSVTCLAVSPDDSHVYFGSKDGCIIKYCIKDYKKVGIIPFVKQLDDKKPVGHNRKILSIAVSSDNKFLAVGDEGNDLQIWDTTTLRHVKTLKGHKKSITGVCFQRDSHTLYSCSKDRSVKVWNLDEMAYVETLFGHQDEVISIDSLYKDRVGSSGGRDIRIWKITEETQLIYNGHTGNVDHIRLINDENFVTGGDDGSICVWSFLRKKPLCCVEKAHGSDKNNGNESYWITALAAHVNTDLIASGSYDGTIRLWKFENKSLNLLFTIPITGFVNAISFTADGRKLLVGIGKEHKFGRWTTVKSARNGVFVIPLNFKE